MFEGWPKFLGRNRKMQVFHSNRSDKSAISTSPHRRYNNQADASISRRISHGLESSGQSRRSFEPLREHDKSRFRVEPRMLRDLADLIRLRYQLDAEIWSCRNYRAYERGFVEVKMRRSDGVLQEIESSLLNWNRREYFEYDEEYQKFQEIRQKFAVLEGRIWSKNPPWEDNSMLETDPHVIKHPDYHGHNHMHTHLLNTQEDASSLYLSKARIESLRERIAGPRRDVRFLSNRKDVELGTIPTHDQDLEFAGPNQIEDSHSDTSPRDQEEFGKEAAMMNHINKGIEALKQIEGPSNDNASLEEFWQELPIMERPDLLLERPKQTDNSLDDVTTVPSNAEMTEQIQDPKQVPLQKIEHVEIVGDIVMRPISEQGITNQKHNNEKPKTNNDFSLDFPPSLPAFVEVILRHFPTVVKDNQSVDGTVRVRWTTRNDTCCYDDFTEITPGSVEVFKRELQERYQYSTKAGSFWATVFSGFANLQKSYDRRKQQTVQPELPLNERRSEENGTALPSTSSQPEAANGAAEEKLRLLLCVGEKNSSTTLFQESIGSISDDRELFLFLRDRYYSGRKWFTMKSIGSLSLSQFHLTYSNTADVYKREKTCVPTLREPNQPFERYCTCLPPVERVGDDKEYLCEPAPVFQDGRLWRVPVIGPNMLRGDFMDPKRIAAGQKTTLNQLPKRLGIHGHLRATPLRTAIGWGIYLEEDWHWPTIYLVLVTVALFSLIFGIVWSVLKKDLQGGFAVSGYALGMGSFLVGYLVLLSGSK